MKNAAIYKDKKGFIFSPMSTTTAGFLVSTEPRIRVYSHQSIKEIVQSFLEAINASKNDIPTPTFGKVDESAQKEALKKLDIKSFSVLNKKPTLSASVVLENHMITLTPLKVDRSKGFGFEDADQNTVSIRSDASNEDIYDAIMATFDKCS